MTPDEYEKEIARLERKIVKLQKEHDANYEALRKSFLHVLELVWNDMKIKSDDKPGRLSDVYKMYDERFEETATDLEEQNS